MSTEYELHTKGARHSFEPEAHDLADEIDRCLMEVANGERKASEMPLTPLLRAVSVLRAMAECRMDAERWRKAKKLPRGWYRDAFNEIQRGGRSLEEQIDAYRERKLP